MADRSIPALSRTFTFTLEEYAALSQMVDEGMWELAAAGDVRPVHERVCKILGQFAYVDDNEVVGVPQTTGSAS